MVERYLDDVREGEELGPLSRGPMNTMVMMRWSAFQENWHRIHYDWRFAVEHDHLPDLLVSGSWKQHALVQMLKEWAGRLGWVWKVQYQYRGMDRAGDTLMCTGRVISKETQGGLGLVTCSIAMENQRHEVGTTGSATVVLPLRGGRPVPYPFVMPESE